MTRRIQTFSGRAFDPLRFDPSDLHLEDIAHSLAHICRYNGHCKRFYSVAEHSVRLAVAAGSRYGNGYVARYLLLHDASEAYLADIPRPLKERHEFDFYREAEAKLQVAIYRKWVGSALKPAEVRKMDTEILGTEARELFDGALIPDWGELAPPSKHFDILNLRWGLEPEHAKGMFLGVFDYFFRGGE